jgi:serine/threonine protein kinase
MDSRQVIAGFEAERQALALMDHPNIAHVFDAGSTATGRPYFVMELVKGVPLTKYCDEHCLTPAEWLKLFIPVCQAIQHAHQKGIIHRDIKAPNVLLALYDSEPVPKVIDFGIAKAMEEAADLYRRLTGEPGFRGQHTQLERPECLPEARAVGQPSWANACYRSVGSGPRSSKRPLTIR